MTLALCVSSVSVASSEAQVLTTYGTPGLIEMPSAEVLGDGELGFTVSSFGASMRNTLTFQFLPRAYGSFRYSVIRDFDGNDKNRYDRSFDVHFQLVDEREDRPALAIGMRDIGGTGIYSSEYLVATKTLGSDVTVTGGLGWGRLAGRGAFDNPFGLLSDRFDVRPNAGAGGINETGQLDTKSWFRGDASFFGGVRWQVNDRLSLMAEYSPDLYTAEAERDVADFSTPLNVGASYRFRNGFALSGYVIGGSEAGVQLSYVVDPAKRAIPGGTGTAPTALVPRDTLAAASWNLPDRASDTPDVETVLKARLLEQGLDLQGVEIGARAATIRVQNIRWDAEAQAAGRAARVMANTLGPEIEDFSVIFQQDGVPITAIETKRSDLYDLEHDVDGAWRSWTRAEISDAAGIGRQGELPDAFPRTDWALFPYLSLAYFDPDDPIRYEFGAELYAGWHPLPGLSFSGTLRYPLAGTIDETTRRSDSVLPHVRTDWPIYARESNLVVQQLTTDYLFRPAPDFFARVTAGYLEPMYGGLSGELLWYPAYSRLALGAELNFVRQRDFDQLFGFSDYDVVTGHATAYYDLGGSYHVQLDAGRYLAGDWGATLSLAREFNNGWTVGAFVTLTDVSTDDFGEGSFDKGIWVTVPLSWVTSKPTRSSVSQVLRPVVRDGGARLDVPKRLYGLTRDYRGKQLGDSWGRYFR
ncbi:Putative outer membrane lipoprotein [Rhodovulum sp. P5]|uniref:YjbH domain-containing protein n=1 Tax=Rhodovulum sp. P5 TaxID=1564506 RepID=UPI0009C378F5|nr:YjbH domain-containing protein [Rhodovulum sp. P5]ARE40860.1 Putative outer membrane lipoprotein [Rhodovulum sp. P5]